MEMIDDTAINIENLVKKFGGFTAVNNISFKVRKGEVFGFLGANGAGKTTAIRMICGLLELTSGDIQVAGISVKKSPEKVKQKIGYMSQKFSLYTDLSPERNMDFFGDIYGVPKEEIKKKKSFLAQQLDVPSLKSIKTADLPMGFKQRLGLACALLHDPDIIFLDEPTSGVDPLGRREFWEEIYKLSAMGKTIMVTTHFMDEAEYCDTIAIMNFGRVIDIASPDSIKEKYSSANLNDAFIKAIEMDRKKVEDN
ncbi:MAG: ABC transporter ATP-binding protein [Spirochaetaceae bacterium]|nr:ABC transporter ATP-binding protein [Spirochaetaceae bacterium]